MTIDLHTGEWRVGPHIVSPSLRLQEFLESPLGAAAKEILRNAEWRIYALQVDDEQEVFGANFVFKGEYLEEVRFAPANPAQSWGNWSKDEEQRRKNHLNKLLQAMLGSCPCKFLWGEALTEIDPKGGFAYAALRYTRVIDN